LTVHSIGEAFQAFPKIARLARECVVSEKIDGTNGQVYISHHSPELLKTLPPPVATFQGDDYFAMDVVSVWAGSRSRWLQPGKSNDNFGFATTLNLQNRGRYDDACHWNLSLGCFLGWGSLRNEERFSKRRSWKNITLHYRRP
jgi:hypothetical protein